VAPFYPKGGDSGGQVRVTATHRALKRDWAVRGIYLDRDAGGFPTPSDATVLALRDRARFGSATSRTRDRVLRLVQWTALEARLPATDIFRVSSAELRSAVDRAAREVDVVLVEFGQLAPCRPATKPAVLVAHDLIWRKEELRVRSRRHRPGQYSALESRRLELEARLLKRLEAAEYARYDAVVTVSHADRDALLDAWLTNGATPPPVFVSPNGVDLESFASVDDQGQEGVAAFVGGLAHAPNRDAVELLAQSILPRIGGGLRRLLVAGVDTERINKPPMVGLGRVEEIQKVYEESSITLAPIRWGSGTRIKIIESLACARPVVAFPEAAEGLDDLVASGGLLIAQDDQQFAEMTERLLLDPARARRLGAAGKRAAQVFDWSQGLTGLQEALESAVASREVARPHPTTSHT
jgi:glycosyltransferase involved in cell wall biosynthesis